MLINVKMPTIVSILTFMSKINSMLSWVEHEKFYRLWTCYALWGAYWVHYGLLTLHELLICSLLSLRACWSGSTPFLKREHSFEKVLCSEYATLFWSTPMVMNRGKSLPYLKVASSCCAAVPATIYIGCRAAGDQAMLAVRSISFTFIVKLFL